MDMWEPYAQFLLSVVDDAEDKIVFDRFHIVGPINDAVDLVRRHENKALRADGDDRLVGTKHLWLCGKPVKKVAALPGVPARRQS
jgi:transposase